MTKGDDSKFFTRALSIDLLVECHAFLQGKPKDLTGLADSENARQSVFKMPIYVFDCRVVIYLAIRGIGEIIVVKISIVCSSFNITNIISRTCAKNNLHIRRVFIKGGHFNCKNDKDMVYFFKIKN